MPWVHQRGSLVAVISAQLVALFIVCVAGHARATCDASCEHTMGYRPVLHGGAHLEPRSSDLLHHRDRALLATQQDTSVAQPQNPRTMLKTAPRAMR
jgi:hypothetical protein